MAVSLKTLNFWRAPSDFSRTPGWKLQCQEIFLKIQATQGRGPQSDVKNEKFCLLLRQYSTYFSKNIGFRKWDLEL